MLRYVLAAQAFKLFSLNAATKSLYRGIGNHFGGKSRASGISPHYISRAHTNLLAIEQAGGVADGMQLLEMGTGWVHWESLFTRLFYDVRVILFDVWDNRQFDGFHRYVVELRGRLAKEVDRPPEAIARAEALLDELATLDGFDAVYQRLGFTYLIDPVGSLAKVPSQSVDLIISSDVLEHVPASAVTISIGDMARVLKPGGLAAHQIVPSDHLVIYDRSANGKNYIRYTDAQWKRWFENDVQYFNRIQRPEWVRLFREAGFEIVVDEIVSSTDISGITPSASFAGCSREDLAATVTRLIARKPG